MLDLRGNPACEAHNYRTKALQYVVDLFQLDGQRVKDMERQSAATQVCGWGVYCYDFLLLSITFYCS